MPVGRQRRGVTQTLLERANLLDRRSREREALPIIEQGLAVARTVGNRLRRFGCGFSRRRRFAIWATRRAPPISRVRPSIWR